MHERWKKAVVHLESAGSNTSFREYHESMKKIWDALDKGQLKSEDFVRAVPERINDVRKGGTAIYVTHESRKYLITARHILHDEVEAEDRVASGFDKAGALNIIYPQIFRVPSLNELADPGYRNAPDPGTQLGVLGAGVPEFQAYTFSSPAMDLAVITLNHRDTLGFADSLDNAGYEPIDSSDILDKPSQEGAEIFSVGYLDAVSTLRKRGKTDIEWWSTSAVVSLPTLTFGRVALLHPLLPFFWADISVYPGSSGGPIVESDKLVGIVSYQATAAVEFQHEAMEDWSMRLPLARCIAASNVMDLLDRQKAKDQASGQQREAAARRRSERHHLASGEESN